MAALIFPFAASRKRRTDSGGWIIAIARRGPVLGIAVDGQMGCQIRLIVAVYPQGKDRTLGEAVDFRMLVRAGIGSDLVDLRADFGDPRWQCVIHRRFDPKAVFHIRHQAVCPEPEPVMKRGMIHRHLVHKTMPSEKFPQNMATDAEHRGNRIIRRSFREFVTTVAAACAPRPFHAEPSGGCIHADGEKFPMRCMIQALKGLRRNTS